MGNEVAQLNKQNIKMNSISDNSKEQKFFIQMECITHETIEISASNIEDAIEKAKCADMKGLYEECLPVSAVSEDGNHEWNI